MDNLQPYFNNIFLFINFRSCHFFSILKFEKHLHLTYEVLCSSFLPSVRPSKTNSSDYCIITKVNKDWLHPSSILTRVRWCFSTTETLVGEIVVNRIMKKLQKIKKKIQNNMQKCIIFAFKFITI